MPVVDPADIPALWARRGLIASVLASTKGAPLTWVDDAGLHHDDAGGNWARLALRGGRRGRP